MLIQVRFVGDNYTTAYEYKVLPSMVGKLAVGDTVVVDTKYGLKTAEVKDIISHNSKKATKYIVTKVDVEAYNRELEEMKEAEAALAELDALVKKLDEEDKYRRLRGDPVAEALLKKAGLI